MKTTGTRLCLAVSLLLVYLTACFNRTGTLDEIKKRGTLLIGLDPSYLPFEALAADGELYGLDVDLGRELANRLGVEAHYVFVGYDGLYHALDLRQVDILISALVIEPERQQDVAYSRAYIDAGLVMVVSEGLSKTLGKMEQMGGKKISVEYASTADVEVRRWARRLDGLEVQTRETTQGALDAVQAGEADAGIVDGITARLYLRDHEGLEIVDAPVTSEFYAIALRIHDRALLEAINKVLESMEKDGTLEAIRKRWL